MNKKDYRLIKILNIYINLKSLNDLTAISN